MIFTCRPTDIFMAKVHSCHNNSLENPVVAAPGNVETICNGLPASWLAVAHKKVRISLDNLSGENFER